MALTSASKDGNDQIERLSSLQPKKNQCANTMKIKEKINKLHAEYNTIVLDSCSDLLKPWRETHMLKGCSVGLVSGSDLPKHLEGTHTLKECSVVLVSGSDLLKHWRGTHNLEG